MTDPGSFPGKSEADDMKMKKKKGDGKKQNKVTVVKLFSFADSYDHFMMAIGSVGACVHGASIPVFLIFFGKLINVIGMAYLFPKEASHKVGKVNFCMHQYWKDYIKAISNTNYYYYNFFFFVVFTGFCISQYCYIVFRMDRYDNFNQLFILLLLFN
jgi:fatty acid desaturase